MNVSQWQSERITLHQISMLLPKQSQAVVLVRDGLKQIEIASLMGITQGSVAKLLSRAEKRIKEIDAD